MPRIHSLRCPAEEATQQMVHSMMILGCFILTKPSALQSPERGLSIHAIISIQQPFHQPPGTKIHPAVRQKNRAIP